MRRTAIVAIAAAAIALGGSPSVAYGGVSVPAGGSAPGSFLVRPTRFTPAPVPHGLQRAGLLPGAEKIGVDFVLSSRDPVGEQALLASLYDPSSPTYHQWLPPGQFDARFGPSEQHLAAVREWLSERGLPPGTIDGLVLHLDAPASHVAAAMGVVFDRYRLPGGGSAYRADQPPRMPLQVASDLAGVTGLDDLTHFRSHLVPALTPHTASSPAAIGDRYGVGTLESQGFTGSGQTIGIYELAGMSAQDVNTFESQNGYSNPVSVESIDGGAPLDFAGGGTEEADLDVEDALSQAPGSKIIVYQGPQTGSGPLDIFAAMVNDDTAKEISTSWGACEGDYASGGPNGDISAYDQVFQQAAAQGQAIMAAAGDAGSEDCFQTDGTTQLAVDFPGSDPMVTDVGGTTLTSPQSVWNDCQGTGDSTCALNGGGAAGGGMSDVFAKPSWQQGLDGFTWPAGSGQSCGQGGSNCRGVPDVAADADPRTGYRIYYNGSSTVVGGTSAAAPLITGIAADVATSCVAPPGDLAPALYAYAGEDPGRLYGTAFTDVALGNNDLTNTNGGDYQAASGYDLASGIGTPLASGWACPQVTGVSPAHASAGTQVTVSGSNLAHASLFFGSVVATVVSASATQATVTVPDGSGTVAVSASTPLGRGVSTMQFVYHSQSGGHGNGPGYWLAGADGTVTSFGSATGYGSAHFTAGQGTASSVAAVPGGSGYWVVSTGGFVQGFGSAYGYGVSGTVSGGASVVATSSTSDGKGFWLATNTGQVLTAGDATFYGSPQASGLALAAPIVGMAPSRHGYWLVGSDGGVFTFGDAGYYGSTGQLNPSLLPGGSNGLHLVEPVEGMAATPDAGGYWLVAADGGIFAFGDAGFFGSRGGKPLDQPVTGMAATADGGGYWLVATDGGIFTYGDAAFEGSLGGGQATSRVVGMALS